MSFRLSTESKFFVIFLMLAAVTYTGVQMYADSVKVDFQDVRAKAHALAGKPYKSQAGKVPQFLLNLNYDQLRDIRFKGENALWHDQNLPFQVHFFHPGFIFNKTIFVNESDAHGTRRIPFSDQQFNYGQNKIPEPIPANMGFSGLRVHYALNRPDYLDELLVFQGASYFRALGHGQRYGISARGLALDTAEKKAEEFPVFEEFWLERPKGSAGQLTIYALMNSPSVTGAYQFIVRPGKDTVMEVKCTLFVRDEVKTFGIAPLTSMFWYGENSGTTYGDFRPEVHDSDGILLETGAGEWIWRPLVQEPRIRVSSFLDNNPRGFGLLQRDRFFKHYEDLEAFYHLRPSVWVEPVGKWGKGQVRLVELPTPDETNDNIVAFWVPDVKPKKGDELNLEYKLHWYMDNENWPPAGRASTTRFASIPESKQERKFVIDFEGKALSALTEDRMVEVIAKIGPGGVLTNQTVQRNPFDGSWRVVLRFRLEGKGEPVELRCFLKEGNNILTETWNYLYHP